MFRKERCNFVDHFACFTRRKSASARKDWVFCKLYHVFLCFIFPNVYPITILKIKQSIYKLDANKKVSTIGRHLTLPVPIQDEEKKMI